MKAIIIAGLLIASAGASGCATFSQPSQAELFEIEVGRVKSAENKMRANNCGLDPIRGKMPLFGISGITFEMLANTAKPTDIERAAILELGRVTDDFVLRAKEISAMHGDPYQQTAERIWASAARYLQIFITAH